MLLSAHNISHGYHRFSLLGRTSHRDVLHDIHLDIGTGESVALLGQSGCGKSTLVRLLSGLEQPQSGVVTFQGVSTRKMHKHQQNQMRRHIQMVFQDSVSAVDPRQTVEQIISEPLRYLTNQSVAEQRQRVITLLNQVGLNEADRHKRPPQMSGGQLQRVCIARALAPEPQLVILDEALSNLDLVLQIQMMDMLQQIQQQSGISWLLVTHDLRVAKRFCQRVVVMDKGHIVESCAISKQMQFRHAAAIELQNAILPALPAAFMNQGKPTCKESRLPSMTI
ncbi:nickel import ATP-binding protein NikE [Vibrio mangrovi]|uniref:Nickel import ATP-binding protein NikE n=1 Tax=Vibrio mangrovi TaxID=474394 RepID=A0A1Y6IWC9_9VIBR|nr:nickel import ATP-binding protein NikE [Vibrio mangrovi]MDW6004849.1 nickel import ATP-binding protein NikE [Vibrio mangrovi]SMS01140.1 Nickel import ATP-binding protein NikE [Vibrio mangrovi]